MSGLSCEFLHDRLLKVIEAYAMVSNALDRVRDRQRRLFPLVDPIDAKVESYLRDARREAYRVLILMEMSYRKKKITVGQR